MDVTQLLAFTDVLKTIGGVLLAILLLLVMVTVHEFGHYLSGKILGFKIDEFSIGFGPAILKKRSKKTGELFSLRVVPLGGYCAFDGEEYEEETEEQKEEPFAEIVEQEQPVLDEKLQETAEEYPTPKGEKFNDQPPWKRIIVLISGALMNYILALILLFIMTGIYGVPMCMMMPTSYKEDKTQQVPHASWETEILSSRDIVIELDGKDVAMITDIIDVLDGKKAGDEISVQVLRKKDGEWLEKTVSATLQADGVFRDMGDADAVNDSIAACLGLHVYTTSLQRGFFQTIGGAIGYSWDMATAVLKTLGQLITGKLGVDAIGGPVSTIGAISQSAANPFSFLYMAAFIGVNLAVFNLLPVPALDGSKVIFCLIEWIFKKPVNRKVETIIHLIGIVFLFGFAILIDLLKVF